jgi:hypothetical protein
LLEDIHFIPSLDHLSPKLGRLSLNLFPYNHLDDRRLLAWSWFQGPSGRYIMSHPHILDRSVEDIINLISIRSTDRSNIQPQIQIEFPMGWRIFLISLIKSGVICFLKNKTSQQIKKIDYKKLLKSNLSWTFELDYLRVVAPLSDGSHSTHGFQ